MEKDTNRINRNRVLYRFYSGRIKRDINNFVKWIVLAIIVGVVVGGASSFFAGCIKLVTKTRGENPWLFLCLPIAGLVIVFMYQKIDKYDGGTNQVLSTIRSKDDVPLRSAPLIFVATSFNRWFCRKRRSGNPIWRKHWKSVGKNCAFR